MRTFMKFTDGQIRETGPLPEALWLKRRLNASVIPLKMWPKEDRKKPALPAGDDYLNGRKKADDKQLYEWFGKPGERNLGIKLGEISGNLVLIDLDGGGKKRYEKKRMEFSVNLRTTLDNTFTNITGGGGYGIFVRMRSAADLEGLEKILGGSRDKAIWRSNEEEHSEIRVKFNGYAVGSPSIHESDIPYENNGKPVGLLTLTELEEFIRIVSDGAAQGQSLVQELDLWNGGTKIVEGGRHKALLSTANSLISKHPRENPRLLRNMLHEKNESMCEPPLPRREVVQIWGDALKYQSIKRNEDNGNRKTEKEPVEEPKGPPIQLTGEITKEMSFNEVADVESCTVKEDYDAKVITTCGMLLAQTDNDQINVSPNAVSAAGKSYIALEIKEYFPDSEVMVLGGASPTSFFYDRGVFDKERHVKTVSLKGKILILIDNPNYQLLQRMRPLFSHDQREIEFKLTNKNRSGANRTETIILEGFCSVFFCTTRINPDEQEQTRMIFVSPQTDQKKLEESLRLVTSKKCDPESFHNSIISDPERQLLVRRILAIRQSGVREVMIPDSENLVFRRFRKTHQSLIPRHQRDLPRIISFIKAHALLNCFKREKTNEHTIIATQADVDAGFKLYEGISESNELGLSPFVFEIYTKVIKPILNEDTGVERKEISKRYYAEFHRMIGPSSLQNIIEQLETVGLIRQEQDPSNKRKLLIYPIIIPDVGVHAANSSSGSDSASIDSYIDNKTEKECTPTPRIMISDDKSEDSVIYCPNGCNKAFATQEQVDDHCQAFHGEKSQQHQDDELKAMMAVTIRKLRENPA